MRGRDVGERYVKRAKLPKVRIWSYPFGPTPIHIFKEIEKKRQKAEI